MSCFFFKQKTADEMRISDCSSDVCSSDLVVSSGQTVMKLARPEEKEVVFNVAENRLDELRNATGISVSLWANPDKEYAGVVREIAPGADPVTRTYAVKVTVQQSQAGTRLGRKPSSPILREHGELQTVSPAAGQ